MSKVCRKIIMTDSSYYDQLRQKLHDWAASKDGQKSKWLDYILLLPDMAYLLGALLLDPAIPAIHKAKLGMVIAYIISPLDFLPEGVIGPGGYAEDVALSAYVINQLLNNVDNEIVLKHWKGNGDLLKVVRHIIEVTDQMCGSGLWKKMMGMFNGK
jgi:uncharacterized membrane protein YkvA (DUF1232 family)